MHTQYLQEFLTNIYTFLRRTSKFSSEQMRK